VVWISLLYRQPCLMEIPSRQIGDQREVILTDGFRSNSHWKEDFFVTNAPQSEGWFTSW
jgi:hypothetical protein